MYYVDFFDSLDHTNVLYGYFGVTWSYQCIIWIYLIFNRTIGVSGEISIFLLVLVVLSVNKVSTVSSVSSVCSVNSVSRSKPLRWISLIQVNFH